MKTFNEFSQTNQVLLNSKLIEKYKQSLIEYIRNLLHRSNLDAEDERNFQLDAKKLFEDLKSVQYPRTDFLIQSLKNADELEAETENFWNWHRTLNKTDFNFERYSKLREIQNILWKLERKLSNNPLKIYSVREMDEEATRIFNLTLNNINIIRSNLIQAINRIENWNNSIVTVGPMINNDQSIDPINAAEVYVGDCPFSYFYDEETKKVEIDDVLDAGDDDFFQSQQVEQDYFNLVRELKNPGSTQTGKNIILYTARPQKERAMYQTATELPPNIYLCNNLNHTIGLSHDLHGSRDVWKVVVNEKHLIKTNESGNIQYYQTIGKAPIKRISLVESGD